jgi:hypothetical protein
MLISGFVIGETSIFYMFSHVKHLLVSSFKHGLNNHQPSFPPKYDFSPELLASFSTQRDNSGESQQLQTCVSKFPELHRVTVYPEYVSNSFLASHFAINNYEQLTISKMPSTSWIQTVSPIIFELRKPSNMSPQSLGNLYEMLLLGNYMNSDPGLDNSIFIKNSLSLKTTCRIKDHLHLGTFAQGIPAKTVIDESGNFRSFMYSDTGLLFSNSEMVEVDVNQDTKLIIMATESSSSPFFTRIYELPLDHGFLKTCKPKFSYNSSNDTYSLSYSVGHKTWKSFVELELKKL